MKQIRIVLAGNLKLMRQGLRALISGEPDIFIEAEAGTAQEARELVERLQPDVLLLDLDVPTCMDLESTRRLLRIVNASKVILVSANDNPTFASMCFTAGAKGYVIKHTEIGGLIEAIRQVAKGKLHASPPLSVNKLKITASRLKSTSTDTYDLLSRREKEVVRLVAAGHTNHAIASQLGLSQRTVEVHRSNLMKKLQLKNQAELVRFIVNHEIIYGEPQLTAP